MSGVSTTIEFVIDDERVRIDVNVGPDMCGVHRGPLADDEVRLEMKLHRSDTGAVFDAKICRACLSEHMPAVLAELESQEEEPG